MENHPWKDGIRGAKDLFRNDPIWRVMLIAAIAGLALVAWLLSIAL